MANSVLTSDIVNYMVYRYLKESGFIHSSFTFGHESLVHNCNIDPSTVPPGALITFIQRGMQYCELEANVDEEGDAELLSDFKMLTPQELLTRDIDELRALVRERKEQTAEKQRDKERVKREEKVVADYKGQPTPMDSDKLPLEITKVVTLQGHESEVFICAWSPTEPLLASGSGDSTARIWNLCPGADSNRPVVLRHVNRPEEKAKDVTTLDWNQDGTLLATGSYDGLARIWSKDGELRNTLNKHKGPIFSLKWNKKGDYLLSGSVDKTAIIWDAKTGEVRQQFEFHTAPTLDVDWRNNTSFATCSTDRMIYVCKLGEKAPLKSFRGHDDEVNAIKWDPTGRLLASCSDDNTAKVWNLNHDRCVHDLRDHQKEIYTIKWSPTGPGTNNPNQQLLLASASFDATVKLWDVELGKCMYSLQKHTDPVYSVAFSPNGRYVATGSFDRNMHLWSVEDGSLVKTFKGDGGIFEVCWNPEGDKVAACFSNRTVCVVELRM